MGVSVLAGAVLFTLLALHGARARAESPADRQQARWAARVLRAGTSPVGIIPLLRLWRNWDHATPAKSTRLLEKLSRSRRLSPPRRVFVRSLLAEARVRNGDLTEIERAFDALGYIRQWRVIGPFDNEGKTGFDPETPAETARSSGPDPGATYAGRERPVRWRRHPDIVRFGFVSFDDIFRPDENVCGLAHTHVISENARPLTLWLGAGGAVKAWWNGEEVYRDAKYRWPWRDRGAAAVHARPGVNRLLVKVCVTRSRWGFTARVGDARGGVAAGLRYDADPPPATDAASGAAAGKLPAAPLTPLAALQGAVEKNPSDPAALENLARYLTYTGSDDPSERRARQLAAEAARIEPTAARLRLAAFLAGERGEKMRFARQARDRWPDDPGILHLRASIISGGPTPEEALPLLEAVEEKSPLWFRSAMLRADIYHDLGLPETAYRWLCEASSRLPPRADALRARAGLSSATGRSDEEVESYRRLLELRFDDLGARRALIADALERGEAGEVLRHVDALRLLAPGDVPLLRYIAGVYDALGRDDRVLAVHREALAIAPEDAHTLVAYGRALLRAGHREGTRDAFRRALRLRPQSAETRERLEHLERLEPRRRADEAFAMPAEKFLAARRGKAEYPATIIQDLTVNTVFENGLGSSFRQIVIQVHDTEGARNWRTHSIQFDPASQRVDIRRARVFRGEKRVLESVQSYEQQLGQPWYRLYYDTRALTVVLPDLEPGDIVEFRYRIDDVAHRNLFADYYGDLNLLQGYAPVRRLEYVLVTPASRRFYFSRPGLPGLQHTRKVEGGRRVDRFRAGNIPAIHPEEGMPGLTEVSPYLHVSTYRTWSEVGRWYWGLIKDQLYADEALKRVVKEILKGATDTRTRVRRIHNWVVRNTRYVGLEFGIHGYLPYRVPLVVQRGFGDCKDKASLMYTMLREAGIVSRIALVRTRPNGAVGDHPASLAIFDHVIVYVPELDLFLDGTAEHSGTAELPVGDQGVTVLLVGPGFAELRRTPVFPPGANRRERVLKVRLRADGSANLSGEEEVSGMEAAEYRGVYQAPGTRAERFERSLASVYPGAKLLSQTFDSLDELEKPVHFAYQANVPHLARRDGAELRLPPSALSDLLRTLSRAPSRKYPLDLGGTRSYVERRTVLLPPGPYVADLPPGGEAVSPFGRLRLGFERKGSAVLSRTEFELTRDRIGPAQYRAFRRWVEEADVLLRQRIGVRRRKP
jgi:tetratricopeptide (TPR) repeat protein